MSKKMLGGIIAAIVAVTGIGVSAAGNGQEKVLVCHHGITLQIGAPALQTHVDHGDTAGACEDNGGGDPV